MSVQLDIDARQVLFPLYLSPSGSGTIIYPAGTVNDQTPDSTKNVLSYNIDPTQVGLYQVWVMDAVRGEVLFNLLADGTISMAVPPGEYYELTQVGEAHWHLLISGFPITVDGRYITGGIYLVNAGINFVDASNRMLIGNVVPASPGGGYGFEQASGYGASIGFNVTLDGKISYDTALDISVGGPFQGQGTTTLEILGVPVLLDVRKITGAGSVGIPGFYLTSSCDPAVMYVNLIPVTGTGNVFAITVSDIALPYVATFEVSDSGVVTAQSTEYDAIVDTFHGISRVRVLPRLVFHPPIIDPPGILHKI
jgi:hypothetical protein